MTNTDMMKLDLTRHEVLQVDLALINLTAEMRRELIDETTTDDRKEVLIRSIDMWEALKGKIKEQFVLQDGKEIP